jgi:hypothetical protein
LVKLSSLLLPGRKPRAVAPPCSSVLPPISSPFQYELSLLLPNFLVSALPLVFLFRVVSTPAPSSNLDAPSQIKLSFGYHLLFVVAPLPTLL